MQNIDLTGGKYIYTYFIPERKEHWRTFIATVPKGDRAASASTPCCKVHIYKVTKGDNKKQT